MPTAPTNSRPPHDRPTSTTAIVMLRSILHAPLTCIITSSFSQLKHPQPTRGRSPALLNLLTLRNYRKPICDSGSMTDVLQILGPFDHIFASPDSEFFVGLLRKCIRSKDLSLGGCIHARLIRSGLEAELFVSNVLLDMYAKLGSLDGCIKLFDVMPDRDLISWCTLISGCVTHGFHLEAYVLFKRMRVSALRPNHFVISSVLKGCSASGILELGLLVHGLVIQSGLGFDRFVEIGLVDMYAKCGIFDDALKMFYEIPVKCTVTWNAMISGYVQNGFYIEAAELCREMCRVGFVMDLVTLRIVASTSSALEMLDFCRNLHVYSIKIGFDTDSFVVAELVRLLAKLGEVAYMGKLFSAVRKPDVSLYSLLISGYHSHGCREEAVRLAEELLILDLNPKQGAIVSVLNLCLCKEEGTQIHARVLKTGHGSYLSISNALMSLYIKFGDMTDADLIFIRMPVRDVVSWTTIMAGLVQNLYFGEALETFRALRKTGIPLDQHSIVTTINACTGLRSIDKGKQIHLLALKLGVEFSDFLIASLLHLYAKCGYIESSARLFSYTSSHDLILTNVMLAGYCWNSEPDKALDLFTIEYRSGLVPDHFSFSTMLAACADLKSLEVGEQIHCRISKSGFEFSDVIIGNALTNMYVKSGSIASACKFFYSTAERNVNSYEMLMVGFIQNSRSSEAMRLFYEMQQSGFRANPVAFARILRGCADLSEINIGKQVHASVIKMGLVSDAYIGNALVGGCAKSRDMGGTRESNREMPVKDDVLCNAAVIAGYLHNGNKERTLAFGLFKLEEVREDYFKYVLSHEVQSGHSFDTSVWTSWNVLNKMPLREMVLWDSVTYGYAKIGCGTMKLIEVMQREKTTPHRIIYLLAFSDFTYVDMVDETKKTFRSVRVSWSGEEERALGLHS